jgi:hypothetical protein
LFLPSISHSFQFFPLAVPSSSARGALSSRIKTLTLCYPFSRGVENERNRGRGKTRCAAAESGSELRRRNPGLPLRWTNFCLRVGSRFLIKRLILHFAPPRRPGRRWLLVIMAK